MPNYVTNVLQAPAHVIQSLAGAANEIDFNTVIPMPPSIYRGPLRGKEAESYGSNNWYRWSIENWGTKWNVAKADVDQGAGTARFKTAWANPMPVYIALSKKFPENTIHVDYADENLGYNTGYFTLLNGAIVTESDFVGGSEEAKEFAKDLLHYTNDDE
jgi:hypothetical protein